MATISNWKGEELKVIKKGQKGKPGEKGDDIPSNVEIEMEPGEDEPGEPGEPGEGQGDGPPDLTQEEIEEILGKMGDDHDPGQKEGEKKEIPDDVTEEQMDDLNKQIDEEIEKGGKVAKGQAPGKGEPGAEGEGQGGEGQPGDGKGGPGSGKQRANQALDTKKIEPKFNWKALIQRFIMSRKPKAEETYTKISPKGITGAHIAAQLGAGAIKPGEKPLDEVDVKLAFLIDSSGSMTGTIEKVMANAIQLLKQPLFKKAAVAVVKYSGDHSMFKVVFAQNKAAMVTGIKDKPKAYDLDATKTVFGVHYGAGTVFSGAIVQRCEEMLKSGYNVIMFTDTDILYGDNWTNLMKLFKGHANQMFIVFDGQPSYIEFRKKFGTSTDNITYFPKGA